MKKEKTPHLLADFDHIYNKYTPSSSLHGAVSHGYFEAVKFLLVCGVDPNDFCTKEKWTTLHHIAREEIEPQYEKILKLLLKYGANPYIKDKDGKSPLDILRLRLISDKKILTSLEYMGLYEQKDQSVYSDAFGFNNNAVKRLKRMIKAMENWKPTKK